MIKLPRRRFRFTKVGAAGTGASLQGCRVVLGIAMPGSPGRTTQPKLRFATTRRNGAATHSRSFFSPHRRCTGHRGTAGAAGSARFAGYGFGHSERR